MKTVSISGSLRENVGKKDAKKNRKLGKIPCVIYGGKEQIHFTVNEIKFSKLIFTPEVFIIKIEIDGNEYTTILQDIQYHPVSDRVLHVDFLEVIPGHPIVISLPFKLEGNSPGVIKGGMFIQKLRKLKVKALPKHLPDYIILDISNLEIGDYIRIKDVKQENLELLDIQNAIIVGVKTARGVDEDEVESGEEGEEKKEEVPEKE
ncbi:MAG: 50S ribosomal protein L25/general stress protein Ctc [Bacteroidales bacterium]|nr:50S ribosomal protein L25/general stress protein Ctc [Bacteroidales bacterium]